MKKRIAISCSLAFFVMVVFLAISALFRCKSANGEPPEREEIRRQISVADFQLGVRAARRGVPALAKVREMVSKLPSTEQRLDAARFFASQILELDLLGPDTDQTYVRVDNFWMDWMQALRCLRENNAGEKEQMAFIKDVFAKYKEACCRFDRIGESETQRQKSHREYLSKGLKKHFANSMCFIRQNEMRILTYGLSDENKIILRKWFDETYGDME